MWRRHPMVQPKMSRFHRSAAVGLIAALGLLMLLSAAFWLRPAIRARYLFGKLESLRLGSSFEDAQRLAEQIDAKPYGACDRSACEWNVRMGNSELPRWWRGPGETFAVTFDVKDSIVARKSTGYGIGIETDTFSPSSVGLEEQEHWGRSRRREPVVAGWGTSELYRYYEFSVYMTPRASAEDRRRYTSYNYNCFWKYKGCRDARELLPTADPYPLTE